MSDLQNIQEQYFNKRTEEINLSNQIQQARAALEKLPIEESDALKSLDAQTREVKVAEFTAQKEKLTSQLDKLQKTKFELNNKYKDFSTSFFEKLNPVEKIEELNDGLPILLFPLRLETRFKTEGNKNQLWLRVYPDDCNINSKEELLSESELKNAQAFWVDMWKAGGIELDERAAWRSLVNSHGIGRAAWIVEVYKPTNAKPIKPNDSYKTLVVAASAIFTDVEKLAAKNYWTHIWVANANATLIAKAENDLIIAVGNAKAKEIIETYKPFNIDTIIEANFDTSKILFEEIELPDYTAKQSSWTQAAKTMALPDKFVLTTWSEGNKKTHVFEKPVRENLAVSVDPSLSGADQVTKNADHDLILNDELIWMVDFEKALEVGMAIKIDLNNEEASRGFDKIFVNGIRFASNENDAKQQLENLFSNHLYSKNGFELMQQGTPTNNTEDAPAGHSWSQNSDASFDVIFKGKENFVLSDEPDKKSDGEKFADALGIDTQILKLVSNANGKDQLEAHAMNTALFPATLGYFMDEMMKPLFSDRDIESTQTFFASFVSGRGPIPAIRIGKQPYGILPISTYSKLNFFNRNSDLAFNETKRIPFLARLHNLIMKMDATWDQLLPNVSHVGKAGADPHDVLLGVLGLHATSVEFHQHYAQSKMQMFNQLNLQADQNFALNFAKIFKQQSASIIENLSIKGIEDSLPIFNKYFLSNPNILKGEIIDDVPDSEVNPIRAYTTNGLNYIEWLATATGDDIRKQNFGGNEVPKALLYLLLKHSLTLVQSSVGANILASEKIIESNKIFHDPDFINVSKNELGKSKFEHLYTAYPTITGSDSINLMEHIYKPQTLKNVGESKNLKEVLAALKTLQHTPTARLERLFAEHLDCCNYRIDAWKTGLVQYKLTEQRFSNTEENKPKKGIILGAYGWLLNIKPENKTFKREDLTPDLNKIFNKNGNTSITSDTTNLGFIHAPSLNQAGTAAILRNAYDTNKNLGTGNPFAINLTSERVRLANIFLEGMRNGQSLGALLGYQFERGLHDKYGLGLGEADMFIYPLRKSFPLVANNLKDTETLPEESTETIDANNVIDGLKFINHVNNSSNKNYPFGLPLKALEAPLPPANAAQQKAIKDELNRIIDINDAISDLVMAEQVYQVVQGNFERAAGNADAFSKGNYPPDVDVINTPRSGITLTHRMAIHFDADAVAPAGSLARAKAEPAVNKWLADNLPPLDKILCAVEYSSPIKAVTNIFVSIQDLQLAPIDLLYIFSDDNEQAMTALDDSILNFVRYNISNHPKTSAKINYTATVDALDKTKVSFYELGALIKSLRKILIGAKYVQPATISLAKETEAQPSLLLDAELKTRVFNAQQEVVQIKNDLSILLSNNKSIASLTASLLIDIGTDITDNAVLNNIKTQFANDLKLYAQEPTVTLKNDLCNAFETYLITAITPAIALNLKNKYAQYVEDYKNDLANLDTLIKNTATQFLLAAKYDNQQTGIGFMHSGIVSLYESVYAKLDTLIARWETKVLDTTVLLNAFALAVTDAEKIDILVKAERLVSATSTFPITTLANYKLIFDTQKVNFDNAFTTLKAMKATANTTPMGFVADVEAAIANLNVFDVISFNTALDKNTLATEKLQLLLLKEDITNAIQNLQTFFTAKITQCDTHIAACNATIVNAEKITELTKASKVIFGEEALLLPKFNVDVSIGTEFENAFLDTDKLLDYAETQDPNVLHVEDWMGGIARVREKVHHWENIAVLTNALQPSSMLDVKPTQFPYQVNDRWLAIKFRDESEKDASGNFSFNITNDKLLYTAHFAVPYNKTKAQCGIVIDEWVEVIPGNEETTGITFHYDKPNSEPPQTMLLVTPPSLKGSWSWIDIIEAMEETLEMAKKRAVEPVQIETTAYAQFLPTTMMAVTRHWITAATNLSANNFTLKKMTDGN
jgi:hypothetical protein